MHAPPSILSGTDETNSSRSIIIPHINPPRGVSLPSWQRGKRPRRGNVCMRLRTQARRHARTHTDARSPCGGRGHWLTDSFGINAKHEEALLRPSRLVGKKSGASTSNFSLFVSRRLLPLFFYRRSALSRIARLCNHAIAATRNPQNYPSLIVLYSALYKISYENSRVCKKTCYWLKFKSTVNCRITHICLTLWFPSRTSLSHINE